MIHERGATFAHVFIRKEREDRASLSPLSLLFLLSLLYLLSLSAYIDIYLYIYIIPTKEDRSEGLNREP